MTSMKRKSIPSELTWWSRLAAGTAVVWIACAFGCTKGSRGIPLGEVSGTVTFQGEPVSEGVVNLFSDQTGIATAAPLGSNGSFSVPGGIEIGEYAVHITPPVVDVAGGVDPPPEEKSYPNIPEKYRDPATSGLKVTVEEGKENVFSFDMQP